MKAKFTKRVEVELNFWVASVLLDGLNAVIKEAKKHGVSPDEINIETEERWNCTYMTAYYSRPMSDEEIEVARSKEEKDRERKIAQLERQLESLKRGEHD